MRRLRLLVLGLTGVAILATQVLGGNWTPNHFLYKPAIGARGEQEKNLFDTGLDRIDTRLGKEIWVGDPNYGSTLPDAVIAIGAANATLRVPAGDYAINANLTIPANVTFKPERGAVLQVTIPDVDIEGLSQAIYCVVTWTGHGLSTGDKVQIHGIAQSGWSYLNGGIFPITKISDNSFSIPVNTTSVSMFPLAYNAGADPGKITKVLDIRGNLQAGAYQIFDAAAGKVALDLGMTGKILPQWWGAVADDATDCAGAIQKAFNALPLDNGGRVHFNAGSYYVASEVTLPGILNTNAWPGTPRVFITGDHATLRTDQAITIMKRWPGLESQANWYASATFVVDGLTFKGSNDRAQIGLDLACTYGSRITNCNFWRTGMGLRLSYAMMPVVENCLATYCDIAGFVASSEKYFYPTGLWGAGNESGGAKWSSNTGTFHSCRAACQDAAFTDIQGLSRANPCVVTWTGHGLVDGELIYSKGITQAGWTALNNRRFTITKIDNNSFSIPLDTSGYAADYVPATDPGQYCKYVAGFMILDSPGVNLDNCIAEGGLPVDHLLIDTPYLGQTSCYEIKDFHCEGTPHGANFALRNWGGGRIYQRYAGSIDARDVSTGTYGLLELDGFRTDGAPVWGNYRVPGDSQSAKVFWLFRAGGSAATGANPYSAALWFNSKWPYKLRNLAYSWDSNSEAIQALSAAFRVGQYFNIYQDPYIKSLWGGAFNGVRVEATGTTDGVGTYDPTNQQATMLRQKAQEITITANGTPTQTVSSFIPAGSLVMGFTARVTEAIGGATTFGVEDVAGTPVKWLTGVGVTLGSTGDLAKSDPTTCPGPKIYAAASNITLRATGGNFNATGKVRLTVHYIQLEAPAS